MKIKPLFVFAVVGCCWFVVVGLASTQSPSSPPSAQSPTATLAGDDIAKQLVALNTKIEARSEENLKNGTHATPKAWADILQNYDAILAAHENEKTDRFAQVALAKALLYSGYFNLPETSTQLLEQIIQDYPGTPTAQMAATFLESFKEETAAVASRRQLIGQPLPDFQVKDLEGKSLSRASIKGRVVLLSYWTSECVRFSGQEEISGLKKTYARFHAKGFEILGILGLDGGVQSRPQFNAYLQKTAAELRTEKMPWPEYCRIGERNSPGALANLPEPRSYPGNYLIGRDGKIVGVDLLGDDLDAAVAKALAAK